MKCGAIKYDDKLLDKKEGEAKVFTLLFWCDFEFKFVQGISFCVLWIQNK